MKIPARRWRKVFNAVRTCSRLARFTGLLQLQRRSASYVAINRNQGHSDSIDAEPEPEPEPATTSFLITAHDEHFKGLVRERRRACLHLLGGAVAIASRLGSHSERGIRGDLSRSKQEFGENVYPMPGPKTFFAHVRDTIDVFHAALLVCAIVSLALGVKEHGLKDGWYDGASMLLAVLLVSGAATAFSCYGQAKRAHRLASESTNVSATVVRDGRRQTVPVSDLVVGDVVILEAGDDVPADGLYLRAHGHGLQVDDSSLTCDPEPIQIHDKKNPFLASGSKVIKGHGRMLVTAVGTDTALSHLMNAQKKDDPRPLQERVDGLTSTVANIGAAVAVTVVTFTVLASPQFAAACSTGKPQLLDKGLPFAVSVMATFTMRHMVKENALVHHFSAVETMGSVTAICAHKTGALITLKETEVVEFWVGGTVKPRSVSAIADSVVRLFRQGAGINTTGSVYKPDNVSPLEIYGSPTEKSLLSWAVADLRMDADELERTCCKVKVLNSDTNRSGVITRDKATGALVAHIKGAAEVVLPKCCMHMDMDGAARELGVDRRRKLEKVMNDMAAGGLRCIAFAYKQVDGTEHSKIDEEGLTLLGLVGLKEPCRPEVKAAIHACAKAGIDVKMITCDNILAARAMATECDIVSSSNDDDVIIFEGSEFRALPAVRQLEMADKMSVMARSQPRDMLLLVKRLKQNGHVVAVAGNGNKDAAALKEADVALCMDAKGAAALGKDSTIVVLDGKFETVVTAIWSGRRVYDSIQRVVQFQLTFIFVLTVVSFVTPLTTVEIFMCHLVMVVMNTLAVVADKQPAHELMDRPPVARTAPLVSNVMWRNIAAQAAFQVLVLLMLQYRGRDVLGTDDVKTNDTMIFTVFVLCQVFNELNVRELEKKNVFAGVLRSWIFLAILALTVVLLVVTVEVLTRFAGAQRLGLWQWGVCVAIAAISLPVGCAAKFIPVSAGLSSIAA